MKKTNILILPVLVVSVTAALWLGWHSATADPRGASNRLIHEKSPYLLQHAHNPVDWYPWGEEAFARARAEDKLIFLSIGYSTCHWCHVMERESFENPAIAHILNEHFVCIKVDREERPDVDRVYMAFVQATTGSGGWPLSVWLTPDLKPFAGSTYVPPEQLARLADKLADTWKNDRARLLARSDQMVDSLRYYAGAESVVPAQLGIDTRQQAFEQIAASFDDKNGGFGPPPKFPRPVTLNFLYHFYADHPQSKDGQRALEMTLVTLRKMAAGGIHDQLGGGFHRYSVDAAWQVPHFEKMLYDQAQLAQVYLTAFQITGEPLFEKTARDILDYVRRDLSDTEGGFYSAEDADSPLATDRPERAEGAFYVWTQAEIEKLLGPQRAPAFVYHYGLEKDGTTLTQRHSTADSEVETSLAESRRLLFERREKRPRPARDDKIITAWNGLTISAFARAGQLLDDEGYRQVATRAATFVRDKLYRHKDQTLVRSYREGAGPVEGFGDDYAFLIQGLLDLYETTFDARWLEWASQLQAREDELFWDDKAGATFATTGKDVNILVRSKEDYDGAEPSPNSIAALNQLRLAQMLDRAEWRSRAEKTLRAMGPLLQQTPTAMPQMLVALDWLQAPPTQIVLAGQAETPDMRALLREINSRFIPNKVVLLADHSELMKDFVPIHGRATAYLCHNFVCQLPTTEPAVLARLLARL